MAPTSYGANELFRDYIIPVVAAIAPFVYPIYQALSEPSSYYIYESKFEKNPIIDFNRQVEKFLKDFDKLDPALGIRLCQCDVRHLPS